MNRKWVLIAIVGLPILSLLLAWYVYFYHPSVLYNKQTNRGKMWSHRLFISQLSLHVGSEQVNYGIFKHHWLMMVVHPHHDDVVLSKVLYRTRQVHIALGALAPKIIRILVTPDGQPISSKLFFDHPNLLWMQVSQLSLKQGLRMNEKDPTSVFLVDPLGRVILQFKVAQLSYDLLHDTKLLLKNTVL